MIVSLFFVISSFICFCWLVCCWEFGILGSILKFSCWPNQWHLIIPGFVLWLCTMFIVQNLFYRHRTKTRIPTKIYVRCLVSSLTFTWLGIGSIPKHVWNGNRKNNNNKKTTTNHFLGNDCFDDDNKNIDNNKINSERLFCYFCLFLCLLAFLFVFYVLGVWNFGFHLKYSSGRINDMWSYPVLFYQCKKGLGGNGVVWLPFWGIRWYVPTHPIRGLLIIWNLGATWLTVFAL